MGLDHVRQGTVGLEPYEIGDPVCLAIFVYLRFTEGGVGPEPKPLEPIPVTFHDRDQHLQGTLGSMHVSVP